MTDHASLADAVRGADCLFDQAALSRAIGTLGRAITRDLHGEVPVFLTVMNGALVFAGALALVIESDLEFDYVHATRYQGGLRGHDLLWLKQPRLSLLGRTVLLVDDILDEGYTLRAIRDFCLEQGAKRVLIVVLCEKRHGRTVPDLRADYVGVEVPDRYVFGYGMDYYEQGRNLPAIYALGDAA